MGYDVHITRADNWLDSERYPIPRDEWLAVVEGDPELSLGGYEEWSPDDGAVQMEPRVVWSRGRNWFSFRKRADPVLWFREGRIFAKSPDGATIKKLEDIAERLRANVRSDDE